MLLFSGDAAETEERSERAGFILSSRVWICALSCSNSSLVNKQTAAFTDILSFWGQLKRHVITLAS